MAMLINASAVQQTPLDIKAPVLKVIGLGGGGSNTINRMIELGLGGIEYIAANTDAQALERCLAPTKIQLGPRLTKGLGAGGNPDVGEAAAEESMKEISKVLAGADMVFLTAGMGGGTGTGSIPIAARVARAASAITVSIVTTPFSFEVGRRQHNAVSGLKKLNNYSDTLITIPNDRLLSMAPQDFPIEMAFRLADDVLRQGIQGISELITTPGLINVDFSHIRKTFQQGGGSILSIGFGQGTGKTMQAIQNALCHPLLDSLPLENASGIIANFTGGPDLTFLEVADALTHLQSSSGNKADIVPGVIHDDLMEDRVQVILVVTGLGAVPVDGGKRLLENMEPTNPDYSLSTDEAIAIVPETSHKIRRPIQEISDIENDSPKIYPPGNTTNLDIPAFLRRRLR